MVGQEVLKLEARACFRSQGVIRLHGVYCGLTMRRIRSRRPRLKSSRCACVPTCYLKNSTTIRRSDEEEEVCSVGDADSAST